MSEQKVEGLTFPIQEIFASLEGESSEVGTPTIFVRVAGCDFNCPWCDTKESWKTEGKKFMSPEEVCEAVLDYSQKFPGVRRVSFTGGNPLLYKGNLWHVLMHLTENHQRVGHFNIEHPGLHPKKSSPEEVREEREYLRTLCKVWQQYRDKNDSPYLGYSDKTLTISMDVKMAGLSSDEVVESFRNHASLIPNLPELDSPIKFVFKYVVGDVCDLQNLEENLWVIRRRNVGNMPLHEYIGIIRNKKNQVDPFLLEKTMDLLMNRATFRNFRLNSNLHIHLGLK